MKKIVLHGKYGKGKYAVVDDDDYNLVSPYRWYYLKGGYARAEIFDGSKQRKRILMHRLILNASDGDVVDHINGNGLDNRKSNIRICTFTQNGQNRRPNINSSSTYKGVSFHRKHNKWTARIRVNGRLINIGLFESEIDAARAYDIMAIKHFGEYANINFPGKPLDYDAIHRRCETVKTSTYIGVYYDKKRNKWGASISINGKSKYIGRFDNEIDAAHNYDRYVIQHELNHALNFPLIQEVI